MRHSSLIAALPLLALSACGGASGPQTVGSTAPPAGNTSTSTNSGSGGGVTPTPSPSATPTPTPTSGTGGGVTPTPSPGATPTPTATQFLDVSTETTFNAIGAFQSLGVTETGNYNQTGPVLYQGNASTVRTPTGTVAYSPRDGIFTISFNDSKAGIATTSRFQDPAHRTQFATWGVPTLSDFNYLEAVGPTAHAGAVGDPTDKGRSDTITFFYQRPGSQTTYVSLAGYVRNAFEPTTDPTIFKAQSSSEFERGAMVFGQQTLRSQVPITGTGHYEGGLLATMVSNTNANSTIPNYFQWIAGTAKIDFNFANSTFNNLILNGVVSVADYAGQPVPANLTGVPGGSIFNAVGSGRIDLTQSGGFIGQIDSASFTSTNGAVIPIYDRVNPVTPVAGANSIDGTYFGPGAVNIGGNFRIVGGVPDQRVDILGAFTGAKK